MSVRPGVTWDDVPWLCFHFLLQHPSGHSQQSPPTPPVTAHPAWPSDTSTLTQPLVFPSLPQPALKWIHCMMFPRSQFLSCSGFLGFLKVIKGDWQEMLPDTWSVLIDGSGSGACTGRRADDSTGQLSDTGLLALQGPSAPWNCRLGKGRRREGCPATPCS